MGLLGYLLEFRRCPFREFPAVLPFNQFSIVLFQSYVYSVVYMASHDPSKYQFSTSTYVIMFTTLLTAYYMYVLHIHGNSRPNGFVLDGILRCHKRADSKCRLKASSTTARLSLNFPGVPSRTLLSSRQPMGKYTLLPPSVIMVPEAMSAETAF